MTFKELLAAWLGYEHTDRIPLSRSDDPQISAHKGCEVVSYAYDWSKLRAIYAYKRKPLCVHLSRQPNESTDSQNARDMITLVLARKNVNYIRNGAQGMRRMQFTGRGLVKSLVLSNSELDAWLAGLAKKDAGEIGAMFHVEYAPVRDKVYTNDSYHRLFWLRRLADGKGWSPQTTREAESSADRVDTLVRVENLKPYPANPRTLSALCAMCEGDQTVLAYDLMDRVLAGFERNRRDRRRSWQGARETLAQVKMVKIHKQSDEAKHWIDQRVVLNGLADKEEESA